MRRTLTRSFLAAALCACNSPVPAGPLDSASDPHEPDTDASGSTGLASTTGPDETTTGTTEPSIDTTGTTSTSGGAGDSMDVGTATSSGTDASSSSTGPALPVCGDGIVDGDETCDDMNDNPDDGCKLCTKDRIVFASSVRYQGFALDGLFGADQRCRMLAAIAMLPNFGTYRAWLSDSTTSAADRFLHSRGRYILVNGLVVANDWDDLIDGTLSNPINTTEFSEIPNGTCAWTGTLANGQTAFGSSSCDDWDGGDDLQEGGRGVGDQLDNWWSFISHGPCGSECALYCFEN